MPKVIPKIEPMGIRPQFKRIKAYLKSYTRGFDEDEYQRKLAHLQRYAAEGEGFVCGPGALPGQPLRFDFSYAFLELVGVYWVTRWFAVQGALGGAGDWYPQWQRSAAYGYWAYRMDLERRTQATSLKNILFNAANCLVLGWQDWAVDLARRVYRSLDHTRFFFDYSQLRHPRTQVFVLRLIADWQGWPHREWEKWAFDEPIFNALIDHWRTPDADALKPLLLAACDRHTHESRFSSSTVYDIDVDGFWYDPFEVLTVMKLRQLQGLENPTLEHVLMDTPLGKLPAPVPPYSDALLDGVLARIRLTRADF
jgi:hypothetical protein